MKMWYKFFECECCSEGIMLSHEINDPYPVIDLAFFKDGFHGRYFLTFKQRLRYMWQILTKGTVWTDMVILDKNQAKDLGNELIKFSNREGVHKHVDKN